MPTTPQALAIFDLDNTLIKGDSDHAWGQFLIHKGLADPAEHKARNDQFYLDYQAANLDIHAYVAFTLEPLLSMSQQKITELQNEFLVSVIRPLYLTKAHALLKKHKDQGDFLLVITATNSVVAGPIAFDLGVDDALTTDLVRTSGQLTGQIDGTPCYQEGKVLRLQQWLSKHEYRPGTMHFYSDSINDRPLLEYVDFPIAVDADDKLAAHAKQFRWPSISLR